MLNCKQNSGHSIHQTVAASFYVVWPHSRTNEIGVEIRKPGESRFEIVLKLTS